MQLIRCTRKLLKVVGKPSVESESGVACLGGWHANLLWIERRKCVLFTNDETLFSIFVPGLKKPDFQSLDNIFTQILFRSLRTEGFNQKQIERVLDEYSSVEFAQSNNRSVIGSMNDLAYQLNCMIRSAGGLRNTVRDEVNFQLNRIPMGAIRKHCFSVIALQSRLKQYAK